MPNKVNDYRIYQWRDIKSTVATLNPSLAELINTLPGVDDFDVFEASYAFGENVMKFGHWYCPSDGIVMPFEAANLPQTVRKLFDYHWIGSPFGVLLENSVESDILLPSHLAPVKLLNPGNSYALLTLLDQEPYLLYTAYSMKAGCRSLFTLPKISHKQYCQRLATKYDLAEHVLYPKNLDQQWRLFRDIINAESFEDPWAARVMYFSKPFIQAMESQPDFKAALLASAWRASSFLRSECSYNLLWSMFINENTSLSVRNTPNIVQSAKHLLYIVLGQAPGFIPATNDVPAPVTALTRSLLDVYKIRYYLPVFMQLAEYDGTQPVYYSLQRPSFLHRIPQKSSGNQTINEIRLIQVLWEQFREFVITERFPFPLQGTQLYTALKSISCDFYHPKGSGDLKSDINTLFDTDPRFNSLTHAMDIKKNLQNPENSLFFNGCIKIYPKEKKD